METRRNNLAMILRKSHLYLTHGKMGKLRSKSWGIPFFPNTTITKQFFTLQYEKNPAKSTPIKPKNHYPKIISFPPSYSYSQCLSTLKNVLGWNPKFNFSCDNKKNRVYKRISFRFIKWPFLFFLFHSFFIHTSYNIAWLLVSYNRKILFYFPKRFQCVCVVEIFPNNKRHTEKTCLVVFFV